MGKFCTGCGTALNEGAKFCTKCGTRTLAVPKEAETLPDKAVPDSSSTLSKAGEKMAANAKTKVAAYVKDNLPNTVPAYRSAGEFVLPFELSPLSGGPDAEDLLSVLKSGFTGLAGGFKGALKDKKRLVIVISLAIIWLLVNLLAVSGISPLPVQVLSWITAAKGSFIGGSIGKGLVAALLVQLVVKQGMLQDIKGGLGQLTSVFKDGLCSIAFGRRGCTDRLQSDGFFQFA